MRPLGYGPGEIRTWYLWEAAVELGLDEVDTAGPAQTATGLHQEPVFSDKPRFGAAAVTVERPD